MQKLGHRIQNILGQSAVNFNIFFAEKDPYPNKALTISSEAKIKPRLAGIDNNKESSKDLLWIFDNFFIFLFLNAFESAGKETVPTAIPAIARLI